MSVGDYVQYTGDNKHEFGMTGYNLPKKSVLADYPVHSKIRPGRKFTYLDEEVRDKKHVPNKFYEVTGDLISKNKSMMDKGVRRTIYYEAEAYERRNGFPSPNTEIPDRS